MMASVTIPSACPQMAMPTSYDLDKPHASLGCAEDASPACSTSTQAASDSDVLSGYSEGEWEDFDLQSGRQTPDVGESVAEEPAAPPQPHTQGRARTQLRSKASVFVPSPSVLAPLMLPTLPASLRGHEKDPVPEVIRQAFGPFLKDLVVTESPLSTSVRVVLKDVPRYAPEPDIHEQLAHSKSMQCLMTALAASLGPNFSGVTPSTDESRLSFEYFKKGTDRLCWEFVNGCCQRGSRCHWQHAVAQSFLIAVILPPAPDPNQDINSQILPPGSVPVAPVVVGADGNIKDSLCSIKDSSQDRSANSQTLSPPLRPKSPPDEITLASPIGSGLRIPSGRMAWADFEDDDDEFLA